MKYANQQIEDIEYYGENLQNKNIFGFECSVSDIIHDFVPSQGTNLYNETVKKDAIQLVNKILAKGREEGTTPAQRLKSIVNMMEGENIPKNTFAKFFGNRRG